MKEVLTFYRPQIENSDVLHRLNLEQARYFVVSAHREENVDSSSNIRDLIDTLTSLAGKYKYPIIFSTHPRTKKRLESAGIAGSDKLIIFMKPLGFLDYVKLQMNAFCVVSDSGTITEESSILRFPAVTIRQTHERPEGMDEAAVVMCGLQKEKVLDAVELVRCNYEENKKLLCLVPDYDVENVSLKVVRIIMSYTDYVNRTVWFKQ